ncbi:DUF1883 domain-containing protein, partial [Singulisphaera rosea]
MNHLNNEFDAQAGDVAEVTLDRAANVLLMDAANYGAYKRGAGYRNYGGNATKSPVRMAVPSDGRRHVVVDLG